VRPRAANPPNASANVADTGQRPNLRPNAQLGEHAPVPPTNVDRNPPANPRLNALDDDDPANHYQTDDVPARPRANPEHPVVQPPGNADAYMSANDTRVASLPPANAPNQHAPNDASAPSQRSQWEIEAKKAGEALIANDEQARALQARGAAKFDAEEQDAFERNLAEVLAFTSDPRYASHRGELLAGLDRSLQGPRDRGDGVLEFPLHAQYVGENIPGFDNWNTRHLSDLPGTKYRHDITPADVKYFTPEQQAKQRVFVKDGQLTFENGALGDGKWIFVVDQQGRLIVDQAVLGRTHHSSLSAGKPVLMAGELEIKNGKLSDIGNLSGHFRPDEASFKRFLVALKDQGVDLSSAHAAAYKVDAADRGRFSAERKEPNLLHNPDVLNGAHNAMLAALKLPQAARADVPPGDNYGNGPQHEGVPHQNPPQHIVSVEPQPADVPPGDNYGNGPQHEGAPNQNPPQHLASIEPQPLNPGVDDEAPNAQPANQAGSAQPQPEPPNPHAWTDETRHAVNQLLNERPKVRTLREEAEQHLQPNDLTFFERNLAEIEAFTKKPFGAGFRDKLENQVATSLKGKTVRDDGLESFPLLSQYVGEDIPGFDNWYARRRDFHEKDVPGSRYGERRPIELGSVNYLEPQDLVKRRLSLENGQFTRGGQPLDDGKYIFVVDQEGHLIADKPRAGSIHHSSLSAGKPVLTAGEFQIENGKLVKITNQSGHFRPSEQSFEHLLIELHEQGLDLNGVRALALTLKTDADGRFSLVKNPKDVLQNPEQVHRGPATMLAPLAPPNPRDAIHGGAVRQPPLGWWRPAERAGSRRQLWAGQSELPLAA
jgi:hypothetical protein